MNIQGANGITWTNATWNPVAGCLHPCGYCYARALYQRRKWSFTPAFHPERLTQPSSTRKPSKVFVCSVADLFGAWVPDEWIEAVLAVVRDTPWHTFQFLTKNPSRLRTRNPWPVNAWVGATVDVRARLDPALRALRETDAPVRFVSFEPLLEAMDSADLAGIQWIILGAQTGAGGRQPEHGWVAHLLDAADHAGTAVLMKGNLRWAPRREDFPSFVSVGGER
jgi:protein gp37